MTEDTDNYCQHCDGVGFVIHFCGHDQEPCEFCNGTGRTQHIIDDGVLTAMEETMKKLECPRCGALIEISNETEEFDFAGYGTLLNCRNCHKGLEYSDGELTKIEDTF
ncbi:MAG: hypothetical protein MI862_26080 [Desulfobacterales bacterium]|nr:hypothetical protein [Desulfobacterales bacterium]